MGLGWDWDGIGMGLDLRVGGGIEHLTVLIKGEDSSIMPSLSSLETLLTSR